MTRSERERGAAAPEEAVQPDAAEPAASVDQPHKGAVVGLIAAAIVFAYPVWQALAFGFFNQDSGWLAVFEDVSWTRWVLTAWGVAVPLLLLVGAWLVARRANWWRAIIVYLTAWAAVAPLIITAQTLIARLPQVQAVIWSALLVGR